MATFFERMNEDTLVTDRTAQISTTIKLVKKGTTARVTATENANGDTILTLNPNRSLQCGATHKATIKTDAEDLNGNALADPEVRSFKVRR
jgi:hypothetical protein